MGSTPLRNTRKTFVLDVHPFNPRIAMSAGYDGKTIIWDIWEGIPVRIYETGRFKMVDGKFSPDGTSLVLSDEVGQIFIISTGQGESRKDAQYDQFFLGDYRPLIQDTNGNVLDQETQLIPYRRNMQDLLCDSSMIPYPEPYQNMYQQRRLGALGIEWRPPSVKFAVGPTYNAHTGDYQILPIVDLDRLIEPLPEIVDFIDWEYDNELQSDDNDSEYNVTDEYSSGGEHVSLSVSSTGETEGSAVDSEADHANKEGLRRSKRKKHQSEVEITTSSGRRVKRRNLDEQDGTIASKATKARSSRNGRIAARKKLKLKSLRPQRRAARNALSLFSKITVGSSDGEEDEEEFESSSSENESLPPDSNTQSNDSERSMKNKHMQHGKETEISREERDDDALKHPMMTDNPTSNGGKRRLVLKLKTSNFSGTSRLECQAHCTVKGSPIKMNSEDGNISQSYSETCERTNPSAGRLEGLIPQYGGTRIREKVKTDVSENINNPVGHKATMKWGEVKQRSNKRMRLCDSSTVDMWTVSLPGPKITDGDSNVNQICEVEDGTDSNSRKVDDEMMEQIENGASQGFDAGRGYHLLEEKDLKSSENVLEQEQVALPSTSSKNRTEDQVDIHNAYEKRTITSEHIVVDEPLNSFELAGDKNTSSDNNFDAVHAPENKKNSQSVYPKLRIKTNGFNKEICEMKSADWNDWRTSEGDLISNNEGPTKRNRMPMVPEEEGTTGDSAEHSSRNNESDSLETWMNKSSRKYSAVYKRSRSSRARRSCNGEKEESTSNPYSHCGNVKAGYSDPLVEGLQERRSTSMMDTIDDYGLLNAHKVGGNLSSNGRGKRKSVSKSTVGLRSFRNRRENHNVSAKLFERRKCQQVPQKFSWLMLLEHEGAYRYVPQKGDEVAYLRQGHKEYLEECRLQDGEAPWKYVEEGLKAVEFCKVKELSYSTVSGSGESCCKLTLEFIDPNATCYGMEFRLTLPELVTFPDFLVETTRYLAATTRNWTHRDKCQVWWKNEVEDGGSWWEGRILFVKPKSPEFPDSPWERYVVQYKNDSGQHLHSPWELHDPGSQWEHPRIEERTRNELLSYLDKIEKTSFKNKDFYGIQKLSQVSQKSEFLNRFPAPLSLEVIKRRLENNYYRNVEAVKHDASVMISNADSYFARSVEMSSKIRRLSDEVSPVFSSL
ncbi:hypothetical protein KSP40_PGU017987 [Platanthera guangdongensis]|uniref:Bromo domain-containing protein n=1 Tax=Platanthera guangdongensis TaxID=2320717 RepID=A0ABR2MA78_9ASPA